MFLVGFVGFKGFVVVDAPSEYEARITAFKTFKSPLSQIQAQEREDVWDHAGGTVPACRNGEVGQVLFLRAHPAASIS
jgi:hypothetical protein